MPVDLWVNNLVVISLVDARAGDVERARRHVESHGRPSAGQAGAVVRFVERTPSGAAGELDLRGPDAVPVVLCRRGKGAVPFLVDLVKLAALRAGALPLHAAAFSLAGTGVAVTGGPRSGKTGALLAFLAHGAHHVAADLVLAESGRPRLHGVGQPVRVRDAYLRQLPELWGRLPAARRGWLRVLRAARPADRVAGGRVSRRLHADIAPARLPRCLPGLESAFHVLLIMERSQRPAVEVVDVDGTEAAERVALQLDDELSALRAEYRRACSTIPPAACSVLEHVEERQRQLVGPALAGVTVLRVRHRYPAPPDEVFRAVRPHLDGVTE